jgi:hypothetical protein
LSPSDWSQVINRTPSIYKEEYELRRKLENMIGKLMLETKKFLFSLRCYLHKGKHE